MGHSIVYVLLSRFLPLRTAVATRVSPPLKFQVQPGFVATFLLATAWRLPLRVLAFVFVFCPRILEVPGDAGAL